MSLRSIMFAFTLSFAVAGLGCGDDPAGAGGVDAAGGACGAIVGSCAGSDGQSCEEYTSGDPSTLQQACEGGGSATWSATGCAHATALGGCAAAGGGPLGCVTTWFYPATGFTVDQIMMACVSLQRTYVAP